MSNLEYAVISFLVVGFITSLLMYALLREKVDEQERQMDREKRENRYE